MLWKKIVLAIVLVIAAFTLQCTVCKWIAIGNASPNLIIMIVFLLSFLGGRRVGMLAGFFLGLLIDCFYGQVFGVNTFILLMFGYIDGTLGKTFFDDDFKLQLIFLVLNDLIYNFVFYVIWFFLKGRLEIGFYFVKVMLPELIYTFIVFCIIFIPLSKLIKYIYVEKDAKINFAVSNNNEI